MDYDKTAIAATYDDARRFPPVEMRRLLDLVAVHSPANPNLIVDIGCGTGRFTHPLAERFQTRVIGIDPSEKMLEAARAKPSGARVDFRQAPAEQLPLETGTVDVVFMSMMLHHLDDRVRAAQECRRVLSTRGRVCVRNSTRDSAYPHPRFFPNFQAIVDAELPSRSDVIELFEDAGLVLHAYERVMHPLAASWQELADKLALRADSFIVRLPDAEFNAGMADLRAHAARDTTGETIALALHFFVFGAPNPGRRQR